jgi:hypothetical protein
MWLLGIEFSRTSARSGWPCLLRSTQIQDNYSPVEPCCTVTNYLKALWICLVCFLCKTAFFSPPQDLILSEVSAINMDDYYHWTVKMELIPDTLKRISKNVDSLIQMALLLVEEKKRAKKRICKGAL